MKKFFCAVIFLLCLININAALAAEQRAYALADSVRLYARASEGSKYTEVSLPDDGVTVPGTTCDAKDNLWYKVNLAITPCRA